MKSKNKEKLLSFLKYCYEHPEERFWQALRNWSKYAFIFSTHTYNFSDEGQPMDIEDTFFIE